MQMYERMIEELYPDKIHVDFNHLRRGFGTFTRGYMFTNENLLSHLDHVDVENKDVMGILGSGDHMISCFSRGCSEYVGVDISVLSCMISELKFASIKALDYQEFRDFLTTDTETFRMLRKPGRVFDDYDGDYMSREYFDRVCGQLHQTAYGFFDDKAGKWYHDLMYSKKAYISHYLMADPVDVSNVPYLQSEQDYENARESIKERDTPEFILSDIDDFDSEKRFDLIYLSNVPEFMDLEKVDSMLERMDDMRSEDSAVVFYKNDHAVDEWGVDDLRGMGYDVKTMENRQLYRTKFDKAHIIEN